MTTKRRARRDHLKKHPSPLSTSLENLDLEPLQRFLFFYPLLPLSSQEHAPHEPHAAATPGKVYERVGKEFKPSQKVRELREREREREREKSAEKERKNSALSDFRVPCTFPFLKTKNRLPATGRISARPRSGRWSRKATWTKWYGVFSFFFFRSEFFFLLLFFRFDSETSQKKKLDLPLSITDQGAKVATEWPEGMENDSEAVYGSEEEESSGGATGTEKEHEEEHEEEHGSGESEPASTAETAESPRGSSAEAGPEEAEAEVSEQEQSAELEHEADVSEEAEAEEEEHEAEEGDEEGEPSDEEAMEEEAAAPAAKAAARRQAPAKGRFFSPLF